MKVALWLKMNFVHPIQLDLKWQEIQTKMNFGHPKCTPAAILKKYQSWDLIWNVEKCNRKLISDIQNCRQNEICVLIWNGDKCNSHQYILVYKCFVGISPCSVPRLYLRARDFLFIYDSILLTLLLLMFSASKILNNDTIPINISTVCLT
jgi:hypothetical protein